MPSRSRTTVLASPAADDQAVAWAASAATLCSARQGRFDDVEPLARARPGRRAPRAAAVHGRAGPDHALLMAGRLDAASELAQQFTDFAELQQPGRAIGEVLLAHVLIAEGEFDDAVALLGPAAAALERTGYSWGPLSLMLLATALAQQGDIAEAAKALCRAESRHGTEVGAVRTRARFGAGLAAGRRPRHARRGGRRPRGRPDGRTRRAVGGGAARLARGRPARRHPRRSTRLAPADAAEMSTARWAGLCPGCTPNARWLTGDERRR